MRSERSPSMAPDSGVPEALGPWEHEEPLRTARSHFLNSSGQAARTRFGASLGGDALLNLHRAA